ncbi:FecCD family ABC transporter permease [Terrisporobacter sp.]|uniref:FecCD family ABC transporter permease n=2 Tax=Terrisporobacter TaxID=1505652 RepID=UPI001A8E3919|nr:iron ABC transporter permease [Terrisporobacter sp.]MBN9647041.1 iron ABC transporter permease [Terrisporobacter glycolicus]
MNITNRKKIVISIIALFAIVWLGTSIGSSDISIFDTLSIIGNKTLNLHLSENVTQKHISIIWKLRLPRVLLAFLVGGCLATSGAVVQSILKNELASPFTLGVSSGASLGAGLIIVTGISIPLIGGFTLPFIGFIFGLITMFSVIVFSTKIDKTMSNNTVVLVGMVLSLFVNALLTTLTAFFSNDLKSITLWQMGSFAMRGWTYVGLILPFFLVGMLGVFRYTKEMDILTFGEEQAKAVGVDTYKVKRKLFVYCAILTGGSVALSGTIGFVDLIAPHVVRKAFGSNHKYVIPMSFLFGGGLMVISDLISRTVFAPIELPVGAVTALIGAPFFAYVYFKKGS